MKPLSATSPQVSTTIRYEFIAFNTVEGWSRDVSEDIAWELLNRVAKEGKPLAAATRGFVEFHVGEDETLRAEAGLV